MHVTKRLDLPLLGTQLIAAGIAHSGLCLSGPTGNATLIAVDSGGASVELPPAAQPVVDAHVAPDPPAPLDFGSDDSQRGQLNDAVAQLRQYLGIANPTAAQSSAALKLVIHVLFFVMKQTIRV